MTFSGRAACVLSRFKPAVEGVVVQPPADNKYLLGYAWVFPPNADVSAPGRKRVSLVYLPVTGSILSVISSPSPPGP